MKKRVLTMLLSLVMLMGIIPGTVAHAAPSETTVTVSASQEKANPGDEITFTVTLGPTTEMMTMQMKLSLPQGITYVPGTGKLADGLKEKLGYEMCIRDSFYLEALTRFTKDWQLYW